MHVGARLVDVGARSVIVGMLVCLAAAGARAASPVVERWLGSPQRGSAQDASLLIRAGTVVTMDAEQRVLTPGAIAVRGTTIAAVDAPDRLAARFPQTAVLDLGDDIVLPGLVNTHGHVPMVMYRGLADDRALMDWLQNYIFPAESRTVSPELVRAGMRLGMLEMIRSGTTTFVDMYYFESEAAEVVRQAGMRAVLAQTVIQFPVPDAATPAEALERADAFIRAWKDDPLVTPAVAPHAMYTLDADMLTGARDLGRRHGVPVLIHLAETRDELGISQERHRMSPAAYLDSIGFWSRDTIAAHAVWIDEADIDLLAARGVPVSHNPESNMKLSSGTAPVPSMLEAGIVVGLGTDGAASNNNLDMFEVMRQAALLHKHATGDPTVLPASTVLAMATRDGARVLGLGDEVGSLEAGKRADFISVSVDGAHLTPLYDPVSHVVYAARGSDVRTSMVDGRLLMRDGEVLTLDPGRVLAEARALAADVREAVR